MIEPTLKENMEGIRAIYDHVRAKVTPDTTTQATKTTTQATKTTTQKTTTTTKPPKTTEAPKEENNCACFESINDQAAELRRDATLTCLEDKSMDLFP